MIRTITGADRTEVRRAVDGLDGVPKTVRASVRAAVAVAPEGSTRAVVTRFDAGWSLLVYQGDLVVAGATFGPRGRVASWSGGAT